MSDTNNETSPLRRPGFVVSAVVVGIIVLLGVGLAVSNLWTARPPQATAAPTPVVAPTSGRATTEGPAPSVCGLPGYETSGTLAKAPQATWTLVGTTAAPRNATAGPGRTDDQGYRSCYAHTVEGAVFAGANFLAMSSKPDLAKKVAEGSVVPGPGRDRALAAPTNSGGGTRIQTMGFRVLSYTGERASVDIAFRTSNGAYAGIVWELVWSEGDWKFRLTDSGELVSQPVQLRDLGGYVPWSGA